MITTTDHEFLLTKLLVGGLLGLVGQGIRVIVGLKKLHEEAEAAATAAAPPVGTTAAVPAPAATRAVFNQKFDVRQIWLSLFIGFIAGCLAGVATEDLIPPKAQLGVIAAGYAGTDFIEGILKKLLPGS